MTSARTSLTADDYERMRVGQPRAELSPLLPAHSFSEPPPVIVEPTVPDGAVCEYYRAGRDILRVSETLYRLCFRNGALASKDVLREGGASGGDG